MTQEPQEQLALSVQREALEALKAESPIVMYMASLADDIPQSPGKARDKQLEQVWKTEPMLAGAVYSMCAKVAALDFKLTGPKRAVSRAERMLMSADFGGGWVTLISKTVLDMLTQDAGGFIELLRPRGAPPSSPVAGIAHIDAQRCFKTGDPQKPVIYESESGKLHQLSWHQVLTLTDMPSPRDKDKGLGWCAVSRALRAAQIIRDVSLFKRQKLSGKNVPALIFAQGVRRNMVEEAVTRAKTEEANLGRTLYTGPVIISSQDPGAQVNAQLIELAGLPDGFNEDVLYKWYIATLALDFGTDYSEFAPLPGGNLGSASQMETMAARARGKGPGMVLQQFEYGFNYFVLPQTVKFQFASADPSAERERIMLRTERAKERAMRIQSQEITPEQGLALAVAEGDAPESFLNTAALPTDDDHISHMVRSLEDSFQMVQKALGHA